jgi:processive 1,2-diacylglycerol beta-glucosyltransferase
MRIVIATVTVGGGHLQAATALEEAWHSRRPKDAAKKVDIFDFNPPIYKKVYNEAYLRMVEHAPELWALLFNKTDNPKLAQKTNHLRRSLSRRINHGFAKYLKEFRPEAVLCTHYLPLVILGSLKSKIAAFKPFTVCIVTDFEAHALWMESAVDLYCVAAEETKASLVARGTCAEKVVVTGIPIAAKFSSKIDPATVRKRFGLRDDLPTLLVLAGGFGIGPVGKMLLALGAVRKPMQVVVVAGKNEALRRELAGQDHSHPTHVFGFVTNMHELMAVADLILTKPGGLTSSEALARGKPLLIFNPIPGQEAANSDFLLERGAAVKVTRLEELPFRIERLIGLKKLPDLAAKARMLGKPLAAQEVCRAVERGMGIV